MQSPLTPAKQAAKQSRSSDNEDPAKNTLREHQSQCLDAKAAHPPWQHDCSKSVLMSVACKKSGCKLEHSARW